MGLLDHNARPAQISPATYSPAAHCSAVRSRAVRCRALRCGDVSCYAVLYFEHRAVPVLQTRVVVFSSFFFFFISLISHGRPDLSRHANYTGIADQNVTVPTSTQHSTGQFVLHEQLSVLSNRCSHQTMAWASSFCPLHMF